MVVRSIAAYSAVAVLALASSAVGVIPVSAGAATGASTGAAIDGAVAPARSKECVLPAFGPGSAYKPKFKPADFSPNVTNPLYPLKVGRTLVYVGVKDGKKALNIMTTTNRTRKIAGVTTRVVVDRLYLDDVLSDRTSDYYTQDRCGNVWYFGEDTATLDARGHVVSTDGSFHAGVDGAQPGVFMQAHPELGRRLRQEWAPGNAEDTFKVIGLSAPVTVPYGSFKDALRTEETTSLEPAVVDNKYYVTGIGEVFEGAVKGPKEALRLVEIIS